MTIKLKSIIILLAFALLIQNTCPFGAAGKSSIAPNCGHCPLMRHILKAPEGQIRITSGSSSNHYPLFIFSVSETIHVLRLETIRCAAPHLALNSMDSFPAKILKPPQA